VFNFGFRSRIDTYYSNVLYHLYLYLSSKLQLTPLLDNGVNMTSKRRSFILLIFIIKCISKCSLIKTYKGQIITKKYICLRYRAKKNKLKIVKKQFYFSTFESSKSRGKSSCVSSQLLLILISFSNATCKLWK